MKIEIGDSNEYLQIIEKYNLWEEFFYVLNNNKSNSLPYHSLRHTLHVLTACELIFWREICYPSSHFLKMSYTKKCCECRILLTAALFHDFNHSGGKDEDAINIQRAVDGFCEFIKSDESDTYTRRVCQIIRATQYPYIESDDADFLCNIIRDADLSQFACSDFIHFAIGLEKENGTAPIFDVITNIIEFNKKHPFMLTSSKILFHEHKTANLRAMNFLIERAKIEKLRKDIAIKNPKKLTLMKNNTIFAASNYYKDISRPNFLRAFFMPKNTRRTTPWRCLMARQVLVNGFDNGKCTPFFFCAHIEKFTK